MTHQLDTPDPAYFQISEIKIRLDAAIDARADLDKYIVKLQTALLKQGLRTIMVTPVNLITQEAML